MDETGVVWTHDVTKSYLCLYKPMQGTAESASFIGGTGQACLDHAWAFPEWPPALGLKAR